MSCPFEIQDGMRGWDAAFTPGLEPRKQSEGRSKSGTLSTGVLMPGLAGAKEGLQREKATAPGGRREDAASEAGSRSRGGRGEGAQRWGGGRKGATFAVPDVLLQRSKGSSWSLKHGLAGEVAETLLG